MIRSSRDDAGDVRAVAARAAFSDAVSGIVVRDELVDAGEVVAYEVGAEGDEAALAEAAAEVGVGVVDLESRSAG